ncbi:hypothetical protein Q4493_14845 [Colwellia sp. 1_MG-2023]|uniref:hypothetical protein n=1 Tax=Colwellia sp. 1_MG-2023 TaxID=3062649 RepID=UPI0026E15F5E|nr:hypothetical protein [Colwellia sp. 1_MG-2023]MDO6447046.1 hypothetical protein [Colwellia sp. 1_MG-2023]
MSNTLGHDNYEELRRRVDLVISSFIQEFFLRKENQNIHPVELLNKIMILCQHPLTFAIHNKKKGEIKTYIDSDQHGKQLNKEASKLAEKSGTAFAIFALPNSICEYELIVFQIYQSKKTKELQFIHVSPIQGGNLRESTERIRELINIFFTYFTFHNTQIKGISDEFSRSVHEGIEQHFNSIISDYPQYNTETNVTFSEGQLAKINQNILKSAYSEKVRNFSKKVKKLNESKSISNLPNIVFYQKQIKGPKSKPRTIGNQTHQAFKGYPFDTRIVASDEQFRDLRSYLIHFRQGFKNKGASFFPLNKIKSYPDLSSKDTKEFAQKYDKLFLDILCDKHTVHPDTGEILNGFPDGGVKNLLDLYLKDTSNNARSFADPVLSTGLIHIRYPFSDASPFQNYSLNDSDRCSIGLLQLVIQHYIFEGLSPGTDDREKTSLALITFPIFISGKVPMTASHILQVEDGNESDLDSGIWDHAFYLTQFLSKEIKSNLRKNYWQAYLDQIKHIIQNAILSLFNSRQEEQSNEQIFEVTNLINYELEGLCYLFPFFKVMLTPTDDLINANLKFANIGFNITSSQNSIFFDASIGDPYYANRENAEKAVTKAIEEQLLKLSTTIKQRLFFNIGIDSTINPYAFITKAFIDSMELGLAQKLAFEKLKEEWCYENNRTYSYQPEEELREFALKLTFSKRLKVLDYINKAWCGLEALPKYKKTPEIKTPLEHLEKHYGTFLSYFNNEGQDYIYWDELGKIDSQFQGALRKHFERLNLDKQIYIKPKSTKNKYIEITPSEN